ncbi:hypothetical protein [Nocardioides sp. CFH 31398]|uniref:hypothetical protein n=1 Tax=Nocardioides sp. CFH 31398 TaxID=2919579 RepID=UPI001F057ED5|nr:hypothetical protein [Nocardioides sp. CFH 31398]MCH1867080.1 hypothetical protein [Nocardioides sp. CFH 31398]
MTDVWRAPSPGPVAVHRDQVTYTGQGAVDLSRLCALGLRMLEQQAASAGVGVPARYRQVAAAAAQAAAEVGADMRTSSDVRASPTSAVSVTREVVGVREVARLFGVGDRQARRIMEQAGGTKTCNGWRIDSLALQAEYELRRAA